MILQLPGTLSKEITKSVQLGAQEAADRAMLHANEFIELEPYTPYWNISPILLVAIILGIIAVGVAVTKMSMKYDQHE